MGLPVTVYRWDDAGAPSLDDSRPSAIINILKKCLVSGYGAKTGAGWTVAFEDAGNNKIALRNSTTLGSGGYVQFWCPENTNTQSSRLASKVAQGMTALDAFVKASTISNIKSSQPYSIGTKWIIVATAVGFYISFNNYSGTTYGTMGVGTSWNNIGQFIGDIESFYPNDQGVMITTASSPSSDASASHSSFNYLFATNLVMKTRLYPTDGGSVPIEYELEDGVEFYPSYNIPMSDIDAGVALVINPVSIITKHTGVDSAGARLDTSLLQPRTRGLLPGLLVGSFYGYSGVTFPYIRTFNGKQYMLMIGDTNGANRWLNIEEWY